MSNSVPPKNFRISIISSSSGSGRKSRDDDNPLSALQFEPAWDSDDLYDALRIAYPQIRSHKDRFLRAVIEFYDAELGRARNLGGGLDAPPSSPPGSANNEGFSSGKSVWQPSELPGASAVPHKPQKRKRSGIEGMQATFSIMPGGSKLRTKRPMTDAEREQYRHTKKVGACEPCRKRKRKCVCRLATGAQVPDSKRPRLLGNYPPVKDSSVTQEELATTVDDEGNRSDHDAQLSAFDVADSHVQHQTIEEASIDMAVSPISRSLSLSPMSRAFDAEFDASSFLLCPEFNLGDLAMPGNPITNLNLQDTSSIMTPEIAAAPEWPVQPPFDYLGCEAFIDFQVSAATPNSQTKHGVVNRQNAYPRVDFDPNFIATLELISQPKKAVTTFSRFEPDTKLLLGDLHTLKMHLKDFQTFLTLLSEALTCHGNIQDAFPDMKALVRRLVIHLEQCSIKPLPSGGIPWAVGVKDDAKKLRGFILRWSSMMSYLMALRQLDISRAFSGMFNTTQTSGNNFGMDMAAVGDPGQWRSG